MSAAGGYLDAVRARAEARPEAIAFERAAPEGSTVLTYGGVIERVHRLGEALRAAGYGDGARVAICMENRPAWPVAFLATWYAGGVVVPLDPANDTAALGRMLEHCEARVCVTSAALREKVGRACAEVSATPLLLLPETARDDAGLGFWDGDGDARPMADLGDAGEGARWFGELAGAEADAEGGGSDASDGNEGNQGNEGNEGNEGSWRPFAAADDHPGTINYTSGTTGAPKGVMLAQKAFLENLRGGLQRVHFAADDRILGILPLFHALPLITNCLGPLYIGAHVVFLAELTSEEIMGAFRRHDITVFVCVPAFFYRFHDRLTSALQQAPPLQRRLAESLLAWSRRIRRWTGRSPGRLLLRKAHRPFGDQMRLFITGGAKMNTQVYEDFLDWGFTLAQGYGLTEATAILTATPLDELRGDTVGRPIEGVELRIHEADADGIGEVWARSPSLMAGYYKDPEATAAIMEEGWLRTGDLGRLMPDGHLQITGRAKDVIVLASGKNIYPEELEGYYGQNELVDEICIVGLPDAAGRGERLHGVVVPDLEVARRRGYVNVREMVKWEMESMGGKLPAPQRLTSLEIHNEPLPRTPTRKIKRHEVLDAVGERAKERLAAGGEGEVGARPRARRGGGGAASEGSERLDERDQQLGDMESGDTPAADDSAVETEWMRRLEEVVARQAKAETVRREDHLDLDLGLESLDRIELIAEVERTFGIRFGEEVAGEIHTVGELLDAVGSRQEKGSPQPEAESGTKADAGGRWPEILARVPEGIEGYLGRRRVVVWVLWALLRLLRGVWWLVAGYGSRGVEKIPGEYPFILCANHASYADPLFLCMALPHRVLSRVFFVGYSEYFDGVLGRRLGRMVRNIPIDPNRNLERAMQAAAEGLRRGLVLVIFPEGARSLDGSVQEFRRGAAILARHMEAPLVPAGVRGTHEVWPRGGGVRRHPVSVAFGVSMELDEDDASTTESLRARVIELLEGEAPRD